MNPDAKNPEAWALQLHRDGVLSGEVDRHRLRKLLQLSGGEPPRKPTAYYTGGTYLTMAPTYENMTILARCISHQTLVRQFMRQQAEKHRVYEGTLLHSLESMRQKAQNE